MVYIIAEAGSNWRMGTPERDLEMAKRLIEAAVEAGADAVKFQTYRAEKVYAPNAGLAAYLDKNGIGQDIHAIFRDLSMPYQMIAPLHQYCCERNIDFLSTPFSPEDFEAVDPYVSMHKVASYEVSHLRLLQLAARSGKPVILSTGASEEQDVAWAIDMLLKEGCKELTLMQCTLKYPTPPDSVNLRAMVRLRDSFGLPVGLSDHSRHPVYAPVGAVALGAAIIEKHFTIDNRLPGPDHFFAITADELKEMVQAIHNMELMLGSGVKDVQDAEQEMYHFGRRRIQTMRAIEAGESLVEGHNIAILRPGHQTQGLHPRFLGQIEGKRATRAIPAGAGVQQGDWN